MNPNKVSFVQLWTVGKVLVLAHIFINYVRFNHSNIVLTDLIIRSLVLRKKKTSYFGRYATLSSNFVGLVTDPTFSEFGSNRPSENRFLGPGRLSDEIAATSLFVNVESCGQVCVDALRT